MPVSAELEKVLARLRVFDVSSNGVVATADPSFDLELDVGFQTGLRTSDDSVITELVLHFAEKNSTSVHVWLCHKAVTSQRGVHLDR